VGGGFGGGGWFLFFVVLRVGLSMEVEGSEGSEDVGYQLGGVGSWGVGGSFVGAEAHRCSVCGFAALWVWGCLEARVVWACSGEGEGDLRWALGFLGLRGVGVARSEGRGGWGVRVWCVIVWDRVLWLMPSAWGLFPAPVAPRHVDRGLVKRGLGGY